MPDITTTDTTDCPHDGDRRRKFGGSLICEKCRTVVGTWRAETAAVLIATERPDGTFRVINTLPDGSR